MPRREKKKHEPREITFDSLAGYIAFVEEECAEGYVMFRGQTESSALSNDLLPKIARTDSDGRTVVAKETGVFADFKKKAIPYIERNFPGNDWEWLTLAQHHGLPTRLLDWSRNPLAALWFAVKHPPEDDATYGIVWVFKPDDDDFVDFSKDEGPFQIARTKVYEPSHIARRITAQSACFTVHRYVDAGSKFIPLNKSRNYSRKLTKILIPGSQFDRLKNQLDRCGINDATLFADLDSLCRYLSWKGNLFRLSTEPV